MTDRYARNYGF